MSNKQKKSEEAQGLALPPTATATMAPAVTATPPDDPPQVAPPVVETAPAAAPAVVPATDNGGWGKPYQPKKNDLSPENAQLMANVEAVFNNPTQAIVVIEGKLLTLNQESQTIINEINRLQKIKESLLATGAIAPAPAAAPSDLPRRRGRPSGQTTPAAAIQAPAGGKRFQNDLSVKECVVMTLKKVGHGKSMKVKPLTEEILKPKEKGGCGYRTTSAQFENIVRNQLVVLENDELATYNQESNDWSLTAKGWK